MAKISIFTKIINSFTNKLKNQKTNFTKFNFYIPDPATINAFCNKEKLTEEEVCDFVNYIKYNYFLPVEETDALTIFGARWTLKSAKGNEALKEAEYYAKDRIINSLMQGRPISTIDALWISEKIYVDDTIVSHKRIVTKVFGEKSYLNIELDCDSNDKIALQVNELKRELIESRQSLDYIL